MGAMSDRLGAILADLKRQDEELLQALQDSADCLLSIDRTLQRIEAMERSEREQ